MVYYFHSIGCFINNLFIKKPENDNKLPFIDSIMPKENFIINKVKNVKLNFNKINPYIKKNIEKKNKIT
jgi:hypothetical protein